MSEPRIFKVYYTPLHVSDDLSTKSTRCSCVCVRARAARVTPRLSEGGDATAGRSLFGQTSPR